MLRQLLIVVAIAWLCVARDVSRTVAEDDLPTAGKSKLTAAPLLKRVETFRRKVVFFRKDADLPCLGEPVPGRHVPDFLWRVRAFEVPGANSFSFGAEMTKDGDLVFPSRNMILRVNKAGSAEKLISLAELTVPGAGKMPEGTHIEELLGASATGNVLYAGLSDEPEHAPGVIYTKSGSDYLGRLDLTKRQLLLMPYSGSREGIALNCDAGLVYQGQSEAIECKDFSGKVHGRWSLPGDLYDLRLAPDKQTLLLANTLSKTNFSVLDLKTGHRTVLPIAGRAAAWGANQTLFYLVEKERENGIVDTSLFRFRIGESEPTRLFLVSCRRVAMQDALPGVAPRLSTDCSWLAWRLPVEDIHESGTVLLDVTNGEYRIIAGHWEGVQWASRDLTDAPYSSSELSAIQGNAVEVTYRHFVLFRSKGDTFAILILPHPQYGEDGITYTWYRLPPAGRDFNRAQAETGHGETREVNGSGVVKAGTLTMEWSKASRASGWLYWRDAPEDVAVYPIQWLRLEDAAKTLDSGRWVSRSSVKEREAKQKKGGESPLKLPR